MRTLGDLFSVGKITQLKMFVRPKVLAVSVLVLSALGLLIGSGPHSALAQSPGPLTSPYPDSICSSCAEWNKPHEPFRIFGNTYYVGTSGLTSILITSSDGHVLIDGALPNSAPQILESIRKLGFDPKDVALILNSHAHFDHAGGIAALHQATGARVAASPASAVVIENGTSGPDDPQYGVLLDYPPVAGVERFTPGDTLAVGSLRIASHPTGGHTPGGTSWSWQSCESGRCLNVVYADSQTPISADGFKYSESRTYPTAVADFERGFAVLESLPCDIMIPTHPDASSIRDRAEDGPEALIDPDACRDYAAWARRALQNRLEREMQN